MDELVGEHLRQHRRTMHLAEGALALMTLLTALAVLFSVIASRERNVAISQRNTAVREQAIALSRQLAAESLTINLTDPVAARQIAVAAWRISPTDQAYSAMSTLLAEQQQVSMMPAAGLHGIVYRVAFSPDCKLLASADSDGTVRLWNPATGQPVGTPLPADTGAGGNVFRVTFSPDGKLLASADSDGTVQVWDVSLIANPYAALCTDVGPPTRQEWDEYAVNEPFPKICA
jgi:WD40 repeat protein